jgi:hypothetical protein
MPVERVVVVKDASVVSEREELWVVEVLALLPKAKDTAERVLGADVEDEPSPVALWVGRISEGDGDDWLLSFFGVIGGGVKDLYR